MNTKQTTPDQEIFEKIKWSLPWIVKESGYEIKSGDKIYPNTEYNIVTKGIHPQLKDNAPITGLWISMDKEGKKQSNQYPQKDYAAFIVLACNSYQKLKKDNERLLAALKIVYDYELEKYQADCYDADFFNNNTPHVGQTIDYMPYPAKPPILDELQKLIAQSEENKQQTS